MDIATGYLEIGGLLELDLHSVEELLQKHPEVEPKIRKTVPGE